MQKEHHNSGKIFDAYLLKRLYGFIKPYSGVFYLLVVAALLSGFLGPALPFLVKLTIDIISPLDPVGQEKFLPTGIQEYIASLEQQSPFYALYFMIALMFGLLILHAVAQYFNTFFSGWIGQHIIRDIRIRLYQNMIRLRLRFYDNTPIGRLVTRNINDVETLADVFSQGVAALLADLLQIIFIVSFMFYIDWRLTLVSLSTFPLFLIATYIFKEKVKVSFNQVRTAVSNLNSFVQERITGMNIVQIFNSEEREYRKFREINEEHKKAHLKSVLYYSVYFPVAEMISATGIGLLVWYGTINVLNGTVTLGTLTAFIMYINMFFRPIRQIADRFNTLQMGIVSTDRIIRILDNEEKIPDTGTYAPPASEGKIAFENVWFAYKDGEYVLKDVSFEVNPGETLALVGETGAGKTSIINVLTRFYDVRQGSIKIDDVDIRDYQIQALRDRIGLVLQDVFLFSDSIYKNITLGNPDISEEQVWKAVEMVGAKAFIERLPGKLHYNVQERGATLSVGQRQLISFIRAMVYDARIIILDEATSSVDTETEGLIQKAIDKLMKGRTAIVIAHRLSTIQKAEQIIVMDKGKVVERGDHHSLLEKGGYYTRLYDMQFREVV